MYYNFTCSRNNYDLDFEQFIILKIYQETSGRFNINKIPCKVNADSFRNVFIYNNHEINIQKISIDKFVICIYPLKNYTYITPNIKFGCELETCLNMDCINDINRDEYIVDIRSSKNETQYNKKWVKLLIYYINDVIVPNTSKSFLNKFPKAHIALHPKTGYSDYIIDFATGKYEKINVPILHKYITFTQDSSVKCGDILVNENVENNFKYTFHCEIVSPTLDDMNDIILMYDTIIKPNCLKSNNTTGFHVNVSFDTKPDRPIYFSFGFIDTFLKMFESFEFENYRVSEREKYKDILSINNKEYETKYANKIFTSAMEYTLNKYGDMMYYDNNVDKNFTYDNFIDNERYYRCYIDLSEKYNSIYLKNPTLLEFRLFSSRNEIGQLMKYITNVSSILTQTYIDFIDNKEKIINNLQNLNLKAQIDYNYLESYKGKLFYEDKDFPILYSFEIKNNQLDILEKSLKYLFSKRNQTYTKHENVKFTNPNIYLIYTIYNKTPIVYNMSIDKNNVAKINIKTE